MLEIEAEEFDDAHRFMEALLPSRDDWLPKGEVRPPWIFRGVKDAQYRLEPSAWRPNGLPYMHGEHRLLAQNAVKQWFERDQMPVKNLKPFVDSLMYAAAEQEVVARFCEFVDWLGFDVPDYDKRRRSREVRKEVATLGFLKPLWSPNGAFALAQHHGIPTRLLDFTRNPLFAARFAADDVNPDGDNKIAVWAIDFRSLPQNLAWFVPPRSSLGFLHAQDGLFLYLRDADRYYVDKGKWPAFEEFFLPAARTIRKLTLPCSHALELKRRLFALSVTKAHLFPTLNAIAEDAKKLWDDD